MGTDIKLGSRGAQWLLMTKIHWRVIRKEWQSESFVLISLGATAMGLVLPALAGWAVAALEDVSIRLPVIARPGYALVIAVTAALFLSCLALRKRLPGYAEERSVRDVLAAGLSNLFMGPR